MRTNSRIVNSHTYVNAKKRTVAVRLRYEVDLSKFKNFDKISRLKYFWDSIFDNTDLSNVLVNNKFYFEVVGKSKCAPEDKFDETIGYRIADSRAQAEAMRKLGNIYVDIANNLFEPLISDIADKIDNCFFASDCCSEHADNLINEADNQ